MAMLGGGDQDDWPPEGSRGSAGSAGSPGRGRRPEPEAVPDLPPAWGSIVIPDDLAELAEEAERVRAELRERARQQRWRRGMRWLLGPERPGRVSPRLPALLLAVALLATLTGLLTLGYGAGRDAGPPTTSAAPTAPAGRPRALPALDLLDANGRAVSLRALLPAVILLTDGCRCDGLVAVTADAAPAAVNVLVVARTAAPADAFARVRRLSDPAGELRSLLRLPASAALPGVLVVDRAAGITRAVPAATSVDEYRTAVERLAR